MHTSLYRTLLAWLALAFIAVWTSPVSLGAEEPAVARIKSYYAVLLDTMKNAKQLGVSGRYEKLAPAIRETFDLPTMTRIAVGPPWTSVPPEQQAALVEAFSRMTIATYANRFDGYAGERFETDPASEARGRNRMVRTRLIEASGKTTVLNYLMHETRSSWKVTDVYLSGTVSELATRRSEFGSILKSGGAEALTANLRERTEKLLR
jgi:phospholipid transport system substrate-binding protein